MIKVAPSILSADFSNMGKAVLDLENWKADWIHFDVMDGNFVPNITFGPNMCKALRPLTSLPLDVHLMVDHPSDWLEPFKEAGADIVTFHVEAERHIHRLLQRARALGLKTGVVLNPATPISSCVHVLEDCDLVLLMSVNPGFGGQKFIPEVVNKIAELKKIIDLKGLSTEIEVDGGVNPQTAKLCIEAGATILVAGNAVFSADDPKQAICDIRGH
ncbi:MAG: ribulose-phosphate 3-epimerase [Eubacteriales bacterium]|nr:ribulose-phosphate 3-epimerase [Eubacteriales bacterium]